MILVGMVWNKAYGGSGFENYSMIQPLNNRNFIGIDINQEYVDISNQRLDLVKPYTDSNPNPKVSFILSREDALAKRKSKKV